MRLCKKEIRHKKNWKWQRDCTRCNCGAVLARIKVKGLIKNHNVTKSVYDKRVWKESMWCSTQETDKKIDWQGKKRENSTVRSSFILPLSSSREASFCIWHLVPITLAICLCTIYTAKGEEIMSVVCASFAACAPHVNMTIPPGGYEGVMIKNIHNIYNKCKGLVFAKLGYWDTPNYLQDGTKGFGVWLDVPIPPLIYSSTCLWYMYHRQADEWIKNTYSYSKI